MSRRYINTIMKIKSLAVLIGVLLVTVFSRCEKNKIEARDKNDSKTGDIKLVAINECTDKLVDPYICFDSLIMDSRCPLNAICVWQGTTLVEVTFHEAGNTHRFTMSLKGFPGLGHPSDTTINGYHIIFEDLEPYADVNNPGNQNTAPKATFSITH